MIDKLNFVFFKENIFNNKKFLIFLILTNLFAAIIALFYYQNQLLASSPLFWIFIADCPLFALLFATILYKKLNNKETVFLTFLTIIGVFKYSLWTIGVIILTSNPLLHLLVVISHILFLLQIIVFYKEFCFKLKHILLALIIFLIFDFFDYFLLTHPPFNLNYFNEVVLFSIILTFVSVFFISIFFSKK